MSKAFRRGSRYQIGWIFGKVPNGSWPPPLRMVPISGNHVRVYHTIWPSYLLAYMQPYMVPPIFEGFEGWGSKAVWHFSENSSVSSWGGIQKCLLQSMSCFDFSQYNCWQNKPWILIWLLRINFMLTRPCLKLQNLQQNIPVVHFLSGICMYWQIFCFPALLVKTSVCEGMLSS